MSGIEVPAAAIGVASFCLTALYKCMKGFALLQSARCANLDLSAIRLMIECEVHELHSWAHEVGLLDDTPSLRIEMRDIEYIQPILENIAALLLDLSKIRSEFRVDLRETDEELDPCHDSAVDSSIKLMWQRIQKSEMRTKISQVPRQTWRRIKWVAGDREQVDRLLSHVRIFVRQLRLYLDRTQKAALANEIEIRHRIQISSSVNREFLSWKGRQDDAIVRDTAINAAARVRSIGLILNLLPLDQPSIPLAKSTSTSSLYSAASPVPMVQNEHQTQTPRELHKISMRLSKTRLRIQRPFSFDTVRQLGYLDNKLVLLEWRTIDKTTHRSSEVRVNNTSCFLRELTDSSFHGLRCVGYVDDEKLYRHGYVFEVPVSALPVPVHSGWSTGESSSKFPVAIVPLKNLFDKMLCPSLTTRLQLAVTMMSTLHQLHTSGWLHKTLHWDNVLSFTPPEPDNLTNIQLAPFPKVYLAGYSHARADEHVESTEPSLTQLYAQLYRHPKSLGPSRMRYCKSFDLFSMGCMLLELGLWSHLQDIMEKEVTPFPNSGMPKPEDSHGYAVRLLTTKHQFVESLEFLDRDEDKSLFADRVLRRLAAATGDTYTEVVKMCFGANDIQTASRDDTDRILRLENMALVKLQLVVDHV